MRAETLGSVVMVDEEEYDYEGARRAHGLVLSVLRRLPIFATLGGRRCVPLSGGAAIGTPGSYEESDGVTGGGTSIAFQPVSAFDVALQPCLGDDLLSYRQEDERMLLRLAAWPRGSANRYFPTLRSYSSAAAAAAAAAAPLPAFRARGRPSSPRRAFCVVRPPRLLVPFLRPRRRAPRRPSSTSASGTLELPVEALKLLLAAAGGSGKAGSLGR